MNGFELDAGLRLRLNSIRGSVRELFEQLRLPSHDGDVSGKRRLERVPALQKRNFRNLTGEKPHLAVKQAWRLVDFLEGAEQARLSIRAREGLRTAELDRRLAVLRASVEWKEAAALLREALGGSRDEAERSEAEPEPATGSDRPSPPKGGATPAASGAGKWRRSAVALLVGVAALAGIAASLAPWVGSRRVDPIRSCLALETASAKDVATHRTLLPPPPVAGAPTRPSGEVRILAARDGTHVASTWTSSYFSYDEKARSGPGKGGGKSDVRLRVGGWDDTYVSLLRFNLPDDRLAHRATLQLVPLGGTASFRSTTMTLRAVGEPWPVLPRPDHRLWWAGCPLSEAIATKLPPPGRPGTRYRIDITDLYNNWITGQLANNGVMLEPERIARGGSQGIFNTFHSSRALNEANRPRIIIHY